ncbi:uncharacterized protein BDV14DRAFT_168069 [Aspergillus stella-maris]|uniref:uncharacterized protein n=1 Tax=Aspergillus stella-maris TaxID=1810926 RepID=UPI003CCD9EC3
MVNPISADAGAGAAAAQLPSPVTDKSLHFENENGNNGDFSDTVFQRLTRLANLSLDKGHQNNSNSDIKTLHLCIDTIESILDPRPDLTKEMTLCRPPTPDRKFTSPRNSIDKSASPPPSQSRNTNDGSDTHSPSLQSESTSSQPCDSLAILDRAKMVDEELRGVSEELRTRRQETHQIYELLRNERRQQRERIVELESEIDELRADVQEEMAEREALQGTVHGLRTWVDGWPKEPQQTKTGGGWWSKKKVVKPSQFDADALFDGMTAWMRGWSDMEEEFRNRDEARRMRREDHKNKRQDRDGQIPETNQ